jgi:hypothetical protein
MRIDTSGLYPTQMNTEMGTEPGARQTQAVASDAGPDTVTVSPHARLLAMARRALDETAPVRDAVVADARARIAADARWDGDEVAAAMITAIDEGRV